MENIPAPYRDQGTSLKEKLLSEAYNFEFYQAVKLLEMIYLFEKVDSGILKGAIEESEKADVIKKFFEQESYRLFGGPVVFKSNINPSFPASELEKINLPQKKGGPYEMLVNFMGIAGLSGPMPAVYSQMIIDNEKDNPNNTIFRDFLDIFNNHLIYLMYKVRKRSRLGFDLRNPVDTSIAQYLFSLIGMGPGGFRNRLAIKDYQLLYYTGLLANHNRSISGVEFILSDYLNVKVSCRPLQGSWQAISSIHLSFLGGCGQNQVLGDSAVLGSVVWDQNAKFSMRLGPINEKQFIDFLPLDGSLSFRPMYELTRQYVGADMFFEAALIVDSNGLNGLKLNDPVHARLGWTSWLPLGERSIYDYRELFFTESESEVKIQLENGRRLKLGWTIWVPDDAGEIRYIEIKLNSSTMEMYI